MSDKEIEAYTKLSLDTVPLVLIYVASMSVEISKKICGEDDTLCVEFEALKKDYIKVFDVESNK